MKSYKYFVEIGNEKFFSCGPYIGVRHGRKYSPIFYNIGYSSIPLWQTIDKSIVYADDGCTLVSNKWMDKVTDEIMVTCRAKYNWFALA